MFENLKAEMAKKDMSGSKIAKEVGINRSSFTRAMKGHRPWRFDEAVAIWKLLGKPCRIEQLFMRGE